MGVERNAYGTREDQKACGDAEAAAREGGDETDNAQTGAEVRAIPTATFKTSSHEVPAPKTCSTSPIDPLRHISRYVTYRAMARGIAWIDGYGGLWYN